MSIIRPEIHIKTDKLVTEGYSNISEMIMSSSKKDDLTIAIECYPTSNESLILNKIIKPLNLAMVIHSSNLFKSKKEINSLIKSNITDDRIFGVMSFSFLDEFIDTDKKQLVENSLNEKGVSIIYGFGSSLVESPDMIIYADVSRWEIQSRYKSGNYSNWMVDNFGEDPLRMIKRGYFFEWRVADKLKRKIIPTIDFYLDLHDEKSPKLLSKDLYFETLSQASNQPFSLAPFFDPGVWGGHWMQETFNVDKHKENLAWSFNGVPEENSIIFNVNGVQVEMPANNLIFEHSESILGKRVYGRFGHNFPIRFNLLDTMGGQNLSLQVHPKVSYLQEVFGAHFTQDESYYILQAKEDSVVYLGVNKGIEKDELVDALETAQKTGAFDDEKYIFRTPLKKHDHINIPAGTVHSSGTNTVVLEISATVNRFTFKLWDWGRVDFDGLPRPVNIDHGKHNIDIYKDEAWVKENLINTIDVINETETSREESTGLYETEFIETRRHIFSDKVRHQTHRSVNVLNLVEGTDALVTSPDDSFEPFKVKYAQTFIIPASIGSYDIEPIGKSKGKEIATIKAFVR